MYGQVVHIMIHDDDYYFNIIRHNIKKYREKANMTQQDVADKAGLTMNYIAKIESKKMQRGFSVVVLGRIADALEINPKCLFDEVEEDAK